MSLASELILEQLIVLSGYTGRHIVERKRHVESCHLYRYPLAQRLLFNSRLPNSAYLLFSPLSRVV